MSRTLRAVRAAPARVSCLTIGCAVAVAGATCLAAFPAGGDGRPGTVGAAIGVVAVACLATAAIVVSGVRAQADDIMLATVRGMGRGRIWRWLVAEPLIVIAIATIAGFALGVGTVLILVATGRDAPDAPILMVAAAAGVGLGCASTAAVCCGAVGRPAPSRHGRTPVWLAASECLTLVAAGWLLSRAATAGAREDEQLIALTPQAVALAAVVASRWLARGVGAIGMLMSSRTNNVGRYLAVRRLRRTGVLGATFACVAGAIVIAVFGASVQHAETQWRDEMSLIATGGVTAYESDLSAAATLLATRAADPDGEWLMTVEGSSHDVEADHYRGFADLTRWERVVGDSWRHGDSAIGAAFARDTWKPIELGSGKIRIRADNDLRWARDEHAYLNLSLLRRDGEIVSVGLRIGKGDLVGTVRGCERGCILRKITLGTQADAPIGLRGRIVLEELTVDGEPVAAGWTEGGTQEWRPDLATEAAPGEPLRARPGPAGLELALDANGLPEAVGFVPTADHLVRRVIAVGTTPIPDRVLGLDPAMTPSKVVARVGTVPVLGAHGYLGNLPDVVLDSYEEAPGSRVRVLARDDTPDDVLAALAGNGVATGGPTTADDVAMSLAEENEGRGALAWVVLAVVVSIAGVAVAVHTGSVARAGTRLDAAGLRSAHVPPQTITSAARYEVGIVSVTTIAAGVLVALATWWCTHDALVLAAPTRFDPEVDMSMRGAVAAYVALPALVLSAGGALLARRRDRVAGRPEVLRRGGGQR